MNTNKGQLTYVITVPEFNKMRDDCTKNVSIKIRVFNINADLFF